MLTRDGLFVRKIQISQWENHIGKSVCAKICYEEREKPNDRI